MIYTNSSDFNALLSHYKKRRADFVHASTSSSQKLIVEDRSWITASTHLGLPAVRQIGIVKQQVLKNGKDLDFSESEAWREYYRVGEYISGRNGRIKTWHREDVSEFDLSRAYWDTAYSLNLISEKTYQRFLRYKTKKLRLMALGACAKKEVIRTYEKGREVDIRTEVNELGRKIFRRIAFDVSKEMERLSFEYESYGFCFYWFDNIVFTIVLKQIESRYEYKRREWLDMRYRRERFFHQFEFSDGRIFSLPFRGDRPFKGHVLGLPG